MARPPRDKHTPGQKQRKAEREKARARAREEARKAREQAQKRKARHQALKTAGVTVGILVAVIAACAAVAVFVLIRNHPTRVTGNLHGVRNISFVEGVQHDSGVSPVCGCEHPPLDEWRGVTFGARRLTLTRTGRSPWTEWQLQSASDAPFTDASLQPRDWLTVTAVQFKTDRAFDPQWMLAGMARHVTVLRERRFSAYRFLLLDHSPLHVAMLGPVPLAAWVPFPGSQVSLRSQPSSFADDPSIPTLTETYPASVGTFTSDALGQGYPLGDFMLPNLVLWANDPTLQMPLTPLASPAGPGVMTALLFTRSTFSMAVTVDPLNGRAYRAQLNRDVTEPAVRQPGPIAGPYDHGQVTVTLNQPLSLAAYREVQHRVAAQQGIRIPVRSDPFVAAGNGGAVPDPTGLKQPPAPWKYVIQEKYPPVPQYAGFNVWGPLRSVTFANVTGSAAVGDRQLGLRGVPDVTLSGVRALRSAGGEALITAPLETAGESAQLKFRAVANVAVNGQSETTFWQEQKPWLAIVTLLFTAVGAVVGLLSYAHSMRRTLRQNPA